MRLAVIADVHANAIALDAVLKHLATVRPDRIVCLGDLVGYNATPCEVIDRLKDVTAHVVAGNHDRDATKPVGTPGTNSAARMVQEWTKARIGEERMTYLNELPNILSEAERYVAVHGCYLNETHFTGYVTGTMLEANLRAVAARLEWAKVALCGHTHIPMCGWLQGDEVVEVKEKVTRAEWPAKASAVLINPGAVGQPRDGDPRAAYAVVDLKQRTVEFRRTEYQVELVAKRIHEEGLPAELAERLFQGR